MKEQPSGFIERLDLVFYWVADLARAVGFYRDVLGLDLLRQDADSWAEFDAGGRRFALHTVGEGQALPRGGATAVFSVRDLDRAKVALAAHGVASAHDGVSALARGLNCGAVDTSPRLSRAVAPKLAANRANRRKSIMNVSPICPTTIRTTSPKIWDTRQTTRNRRRVSGYVS